MGIIENLFGKKRPEPALRPEEKKGHRPVMWAVGSGKGGVGKSFIAANLAMALSGRGNRVLLADVDLGAANAHTFLGIDPERSSISKFLKGLSPIEEVIAESGIKGLDVICGSRASLDIANIKEGGIPRFEEALGSLSYDYVILDTSPGTSNNVLDMFLLADVGVLVVTPEPTSVENMYRYIKCLLLRRLRKIHESDRAGRLKTLLFGSLYNSRGPRAPSIADLLDDIQEMDPDRGRVLTELMREKKFHIVVNKAAPGDRMLGEAMQRACADYFGLEISFIGSIRRDDDVKQSLLLRKPFLPEFSHKDAARDMEDISNILEKACGRPGRLAGMK
ncbi:MAG: P-loop NTPase [Deltaproteobacteria bacterium]|nr:P-loop NTPase [Deltaproteobacteria bacterium]